MQTFQSFDPQFGNGTYLNRNVNCGCQTSLPERNGLFQKPQSFFVGSNVENAFFHADRFEAYIDVKGFLPKDIQVMVQNDLIQVVAVQPMQPVFSNGVYDRTFTITRSYQMPKWVIPERSQCFLSSENVLVVSCPWAF